MAVLKETSRGSCKSVYILEHERLFLLKPEIVISGLTCLLYSRIEPFLQNGLQQASDRRVFLNHAAVLSLIDPNINPEYFKGGVSYKKAVRRVLSYMQFLGFTSRQLSKEGIINSALISLLKEPIGKNERNVNKETIKNPFLMDPSEEEFDRTLEHLDTLMERFESGLVLKDVGK